MYLLISFLQIDLEQYPTSPSLTASVILTALHNGDLGPGRTALDLGCGTGMLAIGCALVETDAVLAVDCDEDALQLAVENVADMELDESIHFIQARVNSVQTQGTSEPQGRGRRGGGRGRGKRGRGNPHAGRRSTTEARAVILSDNDSIPLGNNCVDTVLTNPPFGTKRNAGMDLRFLRTATRLARRSVYSFHKSSTREFLMRQAKSWDGVEDAHVVAQMRFDLPKVYKFHKEKSVDIEVDLICLTLEGAIEADEDRGVDQDPCGDSSCSEEEGF